MPSPNSFATDVRFESQSDGPDFPTALGHAHPPVSKLFGRGNQQLLAAMSTSPGIAIVGSRQASSQGLADARWFAAELSKAGLAIISGLAQGIDAAAHEGALDAEGPTIAALAHGLDSVYPPQHADLASRIVASGGALISEHPDGTPAIAWHFPHRNRIIAALARAVLVIEAAPRSGSLITARHALDLGVDVFALPGSIHMPQSMGAHQLIREGAQLVTSPKQLLEDLGLSPPAKQARTARTPRSLNSPAASDTHQPSLAINDEESARVLAALGFQPCEPAALARRLDIAEGSVYGTLLILELSGLASRLPDGRWLRHNV